jgi:hypothetical protein
MGDAPASPAAADGDPVVVGDSGRAAHPTKLRAADDLVRREVNERRLGDVVRPGKVSRRKLFVSARLNWCVTVAWDLRDRLTRDFPDAACKFWSLCERADREGLPRGVGGGRGAIAPTCVRVCSDTRRYNTSNTEIDKLEKKSELSERATSMRLNCPIIKVGKGS